MYSYCLKKLVLFYFSNASWPIIQKSHELVSIYFNEWMDELQSLINYSN